MFLESVASSLLAEFKGNLSDVTVVFPNKRASLFMNRALAEIQTPLWSPRYITISELFRSCAPNVELADRIQLVIELYEVYCKVTGSTESLDQFYGWGELMLADFDDIDKHMADAAQIFTLLSDIHELDGIDYLSDDQKKELHRFFSNFTESHSTELKQRFLRLWKRFGEIYSTYRSVLLSKGIAYEGMLYRMVIENINSSLLTLHSSLKYVFIGFNYITPVEQSLFDYLRKEGRALFYQDDEPAAPLPVTFLASPTNDLQARYISDWLTPERIAAGRKTAIVLADETLLETVLHCIPPSVEHVNITVGYPLAKAPITSLVRLYSTMLQRKSLTLHNINSLLRHPYMQFVSDKAQELHDTLNEQLCYYPTPEDLALDDNLRLFFTPAENLLERLMWLVETIARSEQLTDDFFHESVFRMYCILERMQEIMQEFDISPALFNNLLVQIIKTTTIPFHGEPLEGIQIMGVLETRNLDFDHVLMLSCNEGFMPAHVSDTSFIPYYVRRGYSLTTIDNKVSIYRYYFEHLLKRCPDATLVYSNATTDGKVNEMSRFMLQYLAAHADLVTHRTLVTQTNGPSQGEDSSLPTPNSSLFTLHSSLSPSSLARYLRCPKSFYYNKILDISDVEESDEEEMDARTFGNIFHKAAELLYRPHVGHSIPKSFFEGLLKEKGYVTLTRLVDEAIRTELFKMKDDSRKMPKLGGLQVINREMVLTFLRNLVAYDASLAPITILGLERQIIREVLPQVKILGYIDRIDKVVIDGKEYVRIIDYKTGRLSGRSKLELPTVGDIFMPESISKHSDYFLQALLYCSLLSDSRQPLQPNLFYVQHLGEETYTPNLVLDRRPILDARQYREPFMQGIRDLINEILDPENTFPCTEDTTHCRTCSYRSICKISQK